LEHHSSSGVSTAGADLHDIVGHRDGERVVFDHQHRTGQGGDGVEQSFEIAAMQPDGRLVEDVQQVFETPREHDREPGTLRLAARQCRHRPVECEIAKAQLLQRTQASQQLVLDASSVRPEWEPLHEFEDLGHRSTGQLLERDTGDAV
jgi:hypothetical protein